MPVWCSGSDKVVSSGNVKSIMIQLLFSQHVFIVIIIISIQCNNTIQNDTNIIIVAIKQWSQSNKTRIMLVTTNSCYCKFDWPHKDFKIFIEN